MRKWIAFILIIVCGNISFAQKVENPLIESMAERVAENEESLARMEELLSTWQHFLENPIPLNAECSDLLAQLVLLSDLQIQQISHYKKQNGPILSPFELLSLPGFDRSLIELISPMLNFEPDAKPALSNKKNTSVLIRAQRVLERSAGYLSDSGYLGSPEKYYTRIQHENKRIQAGLTAEKDPGEAFFRKPTTAGFDYLSAYASYKIPKMNGQIVLGDYILRTGQGLVIWQGFSSGKSSEVGQIFRSNQGLRPYSSSDENLFFRGIASQIQYKNLTFNIFGSSRKIDANLIDNAGKIAATSFLNSGLHRTENEIADRHSLRQSTTGFSLSLQKGNLNIGFSSTFSHLQYPIIPKAELWQQYKFKGKNLANAGFNYKWSMNKTFLFGEFATSSTQGTAFLSGILNKPIDQLELSLLYRNFSKKYQSFFGQAFAESAAVNDEQGIYAGLKLLPAAGISISAYFDNYWFKWMKSNTYSPSQGHEGLLQIQYSPNRNSSIYARFIFEEKESGKFESKIKQGEISQQQRLRLNYKVALNEFWSLQSRLEFSKVTSSTRSNGLLFFQDIKYDNAQFSGQLRLAWFDTDDYSSRLYAFENDLLYNYSAPALFGKGIRNYFNAKYKLSSRIDIWFKVAQTHFFDQSTIGNSLDKIEGEHKTEIKIQLRYHL